MPKNTNPPNVPQARPVKNCWYYLAKKVLEDKSDNQIGMLYSKLLIENTVIYISC
jgi:hypothetical protein